MNKKHYIKALEHLKTSEDFNQRTLSLLQDYQQKKERSFFGFFQNKKIYVGLLAGVFATIALVFAFSQLPNLRNRDLKQIDTVQEEAFYPEADNNENNSGADDPVAGIATPADGISENHSPGRETDTASNTKNNHPQTTPIPAQNSLATQNAQNAFTLKRSSKGNQICFVDSIPKENSGMGSSGLLAQLSEDEIINAPNTVIVQGTVEAIKNIKISGNVFNGYAAIMYVRVAECYRGDLKNGDLIQIFTNPPDIEEDGYIYSVEDNEMANQIQVGMNGVFIPIKYDEDSNMNNGEDFLYYKDICDYGLTDGRFMFLEDANKNTIYMQHAFPSLPDAGSLEQIADFIKQWIR